MQQLQALMKQEITLAFRNRWVLSFVGLFAVLAFGISFYGMVLTGYTGLQDLERTSASLLNLCIYLIPLLALMMGTFSFVVNTEYMEHLVTLPVSRGKVLVGRMLGLTVALCITIIGGLGLPGIVFALAGAGGTVHFFILIWAAVLLAVIFIGLSIIINILARRRLLAVGVALIVWFLFVFFYDLVVLGSSVLLPQAAVRPVLVFALLGNPIDLIRIMVLTMVNGLDIFGPAGKALLAVVGNSWLAVLYLIAGLIGWTVLPIYGSVALFNKQDL